jgi:hypothetical protein
MNNLIFFSFKYIKILVFEEKLVWISIFLGEKNNYWINISLLKFKNWNKIENF